VTKRGYSTSLLTLLATGTISFLTDRLLLQFFLIPFGLANTLLMLSVFVWQFYYYCCSTRSLADTKNNPPPGVLNLI